MDLVRVSKEKVIDVGSCSFCSFDNKHRVVYELRGVGVLARICQKCLDILKKASK